MIILGLDVIGIAGYAYKGVFQDSLVLETSDRRAFHTKVRDGVIHGHTLLLGIRIVFPLAPEFDPELVALSAYTKNGAGLIVNYRSGRPEGTVWIGLSGGSHLHGKLDGNGTFTGKKRGKKVKLPINLAFSPFRV